MYYVYILYILGYHVLFHLHKILHAMTGNPYLSLLTAKK
jgi:hypothetical protein